MNFLSLFKYEVESINRKRTSNERDDEISQDFTKVIINIINLFKDIKENKNMRRQIENMKKIETSKNEKENNK